MLSGHTEVVYAVAFHPDGRRLATAARDGVVWLWDVARGEAVARLHTLNPAGLGALDVANPRRVTRALERCLASGRTLAALAEEFARRPSAFADWDVRLTQIERDPEELARRIGAFIDYRGEARPWVNPFKEFQAIDPDFCCRKAVNLRASSRCHERLLPPSPTARPFGQNGRL